MGDDLFDPNRLLCRVIGIAVPPFNAVRLARPEPRMASVIADTPTAAYRLTRPALLEMR